MPLRLPPRRVLIVLSLELLCDFTAIPRPIGAADDGGTDGEAGEASVAAAAEGARGVTIGTTVFSPP